MAYSADTAFERPTSAILVGTPGALLNWIAFGFASTSRGGYFWTDVRLSGQKVDERDPIARGEIAPARFAVVPPEELSQNDAPANAALSMLVHADDGGGPLRQLADFIRLSTHTRELIASQPRGESPPLLVLSNAQRVASLYRAEAVGPVVQAIVGSGVSLLVTYADDPPEGRVDFENVWHVRTPDRAPWSEASIEVEKARTDGPFAPGSRVGLRTVPRLRATMARIA